MLLIYKYDEKKVAEVLSEKVDYKYELAQKRRDKLNVIDLENSLSMIYKIEKLNTNSSFNQENAKRFVVSIKNLLQFWNSGFISISIIFSYYSIGISSI